MKLILYEDVKIFVFGTRQILLKDVKSTNKQTKTTYEKDERRANWYEAYKSYIHQRIFVSRFFFFFFFGGKLFRTLVVILAKKEKKAETFTKICNIRFE